MTPVIDELSEIASLFHQRHRENMEFKDRHGVTIRHTLEQDKDDQFHDILLS